MTQKQKTPRNAMESLLAMLQTLRTAPDGPVLLAQLDRGHDVRRALDKVMEQAFLSFVRNTLDRYSRTSEIDRITRLKLKLIEYRLKALSDPAHAAPARPELMDAAALAQHLAAVLWAAGQDGAPKEAPAKPAARLAPAGAERLRVLQQSLETKLDQVVLANLDSIASLGSVELTLKGAQPGELEEWRQILHDASREIIEDYRKLGENLREAQFYVDEIGAHLPSSVGPSPASEAITIERQDLLQRIESEMRRAQRHRLPLSLALLGPDHLENIKLLVGPQAANEIMRRYRESVIACARTYDTVAGCKPHKLLWLLPGADPGQSVKALHKARDRVTSTNYHYAGRLRPLPTFSAGIAGFVPGENCAHFLARAEVLAASAKQAGPSHIEWEKRRNVSAEMS